MVKTIRIQKQQVIGLSPTMINRLRTGFFESMSAALANEKRSLSISTDEVNVTADGTHYSLWYRGNGDINYVFDGSNVMAPSRPDESPLMEWMKVVYRTVKTAESRGARAARL